LVDEIIASRWGAVKEDGVRDSATSTLMKRAKYKKQEASREMGWMSF
jgi:hypothetical protein